MSNLRPPSLSYSFMVRTVYRRRFNNQRHPISWSVSLLVLLIRRSLEALNGTFRFACTASGRTTMDV